MPTASRVPISRVAPEDLLVDEPGLFVASSIAETECNARLSTSLAVVSVTLILDRVSTRLCPAFLEVEEDVLVDAG